MENNKLLVAKIVESGISLSLCSIIVLFLSSNGHWTILYYGLAVMAIIFAIAFVVNARIAMAIIFKITSHFLVITKKGAKIYGLEIRTNGVSFSIINQDTVSYVDIEDVVFVDEISDKGTIRKPVSKFILENKVKK